MATATQSIPQPLSGEEIRKGIAARIAAEAPPEYAEQVKELVYQGLGKTCSLLGHTAYAKFKARWELAWWKEGEKLLVSWWTEYDLDDFGRVTSGAIGEKRDFTSNTVNICRGTIEEVPPDRFRRETDQPIPKPTELKTKEHGDSTFSKSIRGSGKRRDV